jgi:transcriptional regulator with XRE-family HTH domain
MLTDEEKFQNSKRLREAVLGLRNRLGLTQTEFAHRIGKGLATVQRYEGVVPPKGPALVQLMTLASELGETSLAEVFREAVSQEIGFSVPVPRTGTDPEFVLKPGEQAHFNALAEFLRNPARSQEREQWGRLFSAFQAEQAQAEALRLRNEGIWAAEYPEGVLKEVETRGIEFRSTTISSAGDLRKYISELKASGKSGEEIARLLGLDQEET